MSYQDAYPIGRSSVGAQLVTQFCDFCHASWFPRENVPKLFSVVEGGLADYVDLNHVLGSIATLMLDLPIDSLLGFSSSRKGSTLSIVSSIYLLNHPEHGQRVARILRSGEGVMILRIYGNLDLTADRLPDFTTKVDLFDDWPSYQRLLTTIMGSGDFEVGKDGSIFA